MTWVKIDDAAPDHPKVIDLEDVPFAMWVRGLCYCARAGSDGLIPRGALRRLTSAKRPDDVAADLVTAGLWERAEDGAYRVHDFLDYNPSAAAVAAKRDARVAAGRTGGIRSGQRRSKTEANGEANASGVASTKSNPVPIPDPEIPPKPPQGGSVSQEAPAGPSPGAPVPLALAPPEPKRRRKPPKAPEVPLPDGWGPKPGHYRTGDERGLDRAAVDREAQRFVAQRGSKGATYSNWDQAFTSWLLSPFQASGGGGGASLGRPVRPRVVAPEPGGGNRIVDFMDAARAAEPEAP